MIAIYIKQLFFLLYTLRCLLRVISNGGLFINERVNNILQLTLNRWRSWNRTKRCNLNFRPIVQCKLSNGLTNYSFLVGAADQRAVVRVNCAYDNLLGIDRSRELDILTLLADSKLGPRVLFINEEVMVSEYINGAKLTKIMLENPTLRSQIKKNLKEISSFLSSYEPRFSYLSHCESYVKQLTREQLKLVNVTQLLSLANSIDSEDWAPSLCHHDLVGENVLVSDGGLHFLDWEYAAMGHPAYDWVSVFGNEVSLDEMDCGPVSPEKWQRLGNFQSELDKLWRVLNSKLIKNFESEK
ncbi:MAG: hypothetical protein CBC09_02240 [Cellvibrionales bacterium TMED49]|nr:MAG: hypothetical protein CBC09_02240 [Cellvibrionales bacterium TMED49]